VVDSATQEMSGRNLPGGKEHRRREADNTKAEFEPSGLQPGASLPLGLGENLVA
jgi:hypothetical protein